ncbi:MAG: CDP-diacylglycerol--serine O-phosphatidyltransferase [Roseivirga sp.]|nr:CDP-diacylglycerol--serine O-phosphatidyltransferase [Roseivirga sp.]
MKKAIPNTVTLGNLACGLLGIILLFKGDIESACYLIWLAALLDFLDGFLARLLNAYSEIGKQLDSLADLVTFGVLPALIYFQLFTDKLPAPLAYAAFITALFSALRLAKFNIDEEQTVNFKGLTTTANGIFTSSIPLILAGSSFLQPWFSNPWILLVICLFFSSLMVTPVTLFSLKFSNFKVRGNESRYLLILASIALLAIFREVAIPLVIGFYLLLSLLEIFGSKTDKKVSL